MKTEITEDKNDILISLYDEWNERKKDIAFPSFRNIYFREGDIWWCSLGLNVGRESYGKGKEFRRPILVLKKLSSDICIILPLSSKEKIGTWFIDVTFQEHKRYVLLYQIRMLHTKRFQRKLGQLDEKGMFRVKEKLGKLLELFLENHHSANAEIDGNTPKVI